MHAKDRIIVALDVDTLEKAQALVAELAPHVGCFKVGLQLLTAAGAPRVVSALKALGAKVMFDAKFHDIPATMAGAAGSAAVLGVDMFTMHASAGEEGMKAAVDASGMSLALAVTVLTSLSEQQCDRVYRGTAQSVVGEFAAAALYAGADGIVCSPRELVMLREFKDLRALLMVTPGVRPSWAAAGDQKRVMTPKQAIMAGADYLVIGRPILAPPASIGTPADAARAIAAEIDEAVPE